MSTTNLPPARPLLDPNGKPALVVTHADYVIDGVNRTNPKFFGSIYLNGIIVFSTSTDGDGNTVVNPLEPEYGGTGFDNLTDLAREVGKILGITTGTTGAGTTLVPIEKGGTGKTTAADALAALGGAYAVLYQVQIPTSWSTNSSGGFMQNVTLNGILSTDIPIVGVVLSNDVSAARLQGRAFTYVNRITTSANRLTLYAFDTKPATAVTIQLLTIRGYK